MNTPLETVLRLIRSQSYYATLSLSQQETVINSARYYLSCGLDPSEIVELIREETICEESFKN